MGVFSSLQILPLLLMVWLFLGLLCDYAVRLQSITFRPAASFVSEASPWIRTPSTVGSFFSLAAMLAGSTMETDCSWQEDLIGAPSKFVLLRLNRIFDCCWFDWESGQGQRPPRRGGSRWRWWSRAVGASSRRRAQWQCWSYFRYEFDIY